MCLCILFAPSGFLVVHFAWPSGKGGWLAQEYCPAWNTRSTGSTRATSRLNLFLEICSDTLTCAHTQTHTFLCFRLFGEGSKGRSHKDESMKAAVNSCALERRVWILVSKLNSNLWLYPLKVTGLWGSHTLLLNLNVLIQQIEIMLLTIYKNAVRIKEVNMS